MELSEYVEALRAELVAVTRVAGEDAARAAGLLAGALESSVRLTLLDVLSAAAAEITDRLGDTVVEVRLAGGEPSFVVQAAGPDLSTAPGPTAPPGDEADTSLARITLRLPEHLKARVEAAAATDGVSVNTWLTQAVRRALDAPPPPSGASVRRGPGQRITGFARS
jgi:HicB family